MHLYSWGSWTFRTTIRCDELEGTSTKQWLRQANCAVIILAACAFGWDITKKWLFASFFRPLANIAAACHHPSGSHQSIAGAKDEHGIYLSRRSAACPPQLYFQPPNNRLLGTTFFFLCPKRVGTKIHEALLMEGD